MKMKAPQLLAAALVGALALASRGQAADAKKPNILFFHVDNTSVGDWGCYGGAYPLGRRRRTWTAFPPKA